MDIEKEAKKWIGENPDASPLDIFLAGFKLYADFAEEITLKKEAKIKKLQKDFYNTLIPFVATYGKELVREFYDYWSEPNKSMTKIRWQLEPTWDTDKRLKRWQTNNSNFKPKQNTTQQQQSPTKTRVIID
jgi:hypothetical protein